MDSNMLCVVCDRCSPHRVTPVGMGDRVCVDLCSLLRPGEGMLVGSFARALFLVHSEVGGVCGQLCATGYNRLSKQHVKVHIMLITVKL